MPSSGSLLKLSGMKISRRSLLVAALAFLLLLVMMAFPYGPLLPWSPFKPGYSSASYIRADVYFDSSIALPQDYRQVDQMIADAETFHRLRFNKRVKIIACKNWNDCQRSWFWMNVKPLGGITLATGEVVYITPKLKERNFSIAEFLRHELSHAVISQNISIRNSLKLTDQAWFSEGLAVSFGKQTSYLSREEFIAKAKNGDLTKYIDPAQMDRNAADWSARFAYPAQRYFLEFLKQQYGEDRFQDFALKYINSPDDYQKQFSEVFRLTLPEAVRQFEQAIKSGQWPSE